jgi:hypothetical protein
MELVPLFAVGMRFCVVHMTRVFLAEGRKGVA